MYITAIVLDKVRLIKLFTYMIGKPTMGIAPLGNHYVARFYFFSMSFNKWLIFFVIVILLFYFSCKQVYL